MSVKVTKDGSPVDYDTISVTGWGCILIVVPWLVGIAYLLASIVTVMGSIL